MKVKITIGNKIYYASQAQAEDGSNNTSSMTPLRTFQQWLKNVTSFSLIGLKTTSKTLVGAINELFALIAKKADATSLDSYADKTYITDELNKKADTTTVNDALAKKLEADALAPYARSGGSAKTAKDLENDLVQLAGDITGEINAFSKPSSVEATVNTVNGKTIVNFGSSANNYAWGFPIGERKNIKAVTFPYGWSFNTNNNIRIIIKVNDYDGSVLYDEVHVPAVGTPIQLKSIVSETPQRLFFEVYGENDVISVAAAIPSTIYTPENGFPKYGYAINPSSFTTKQLTVVNGYIDISIDSLCDVDRRLIDINAIPLSQLNDLYATKESLGLSLSENADKLLAKGDFESKNYVQKYSILYKYSYEEGHNASTDIKNDIYSEYFKKNVSAILVLKSPTICGSLGIDFIKKLASLESSGIFVPSFKFRLKHYNAGDYNVTSTIRIRMKYTKDGKATFYTPSSQSQLITPKSSVNCELEVACPSSWNDVLTYNVFDDYSQFFSNYAGAEEQWVEISDVELRYLDPTGLDTEYPEIVSPKIIGNGIKEEQLDASLQAKLNAESSSLNLIDKNLRICCAGSSVTWGGGFLQNSMLTYLIPLLQKKRTNFIGTDLITTSGTSREIADKLYFDGKALKLQGAGSTINFTIEGDEISIVQGIERSNTNASIIELYVDGILHDTFDNVNREPFGHESKTFTATAGQKEYVLGRPFTYNHVLKVNGVIVPVELSKSSTAPTSGWIIARDIMDVDGSPIVQHTLFNMDGSAAGDNITVEYDYGQELQYERTTIGRDGNGVLENAYGRGYTAFDPANPPASFSFGTGLDFRETDERVIKTYKFAESKERSVQIKIKALANGATGTPYFVFNFATSRMLYFMNAGVGGWKSQQFNDANNANGNLLRTWREIAEWHPDVIFYESTPNDDWLVNDYRIYKVNSGLSLAQLQEIRTLPNKKIEYNSTGNNYNYERWAGGIKAIDKWSVTLTDDTLIDTEPQAGDSIVVGTYYSDAKECAVRLVRSYDSINRTVFFDKPLSGDELLYESIQDLVGKEVQIRGLQAYKTETEELLEKLYSYAEYPRIYLVPNPYPNQLSRNISHYQPLLKLYSKDFAGYAMPEVYEFQRSQKRDKVITVDASSLVAKPDGTKRAELTSLLKFNNYMNYRVIVNGVDVTHKDAVVYTSYCLGVDRTLTGANLNDTQTRGKQVWGNFYPTLVFLKNAPASGIITIECSSAVWSNDSCHMNVAEGQMLYANEFAKKI